MSSEKARAGVFLVVFSDLDGTLLDHDTYRFNEAEDALRVLRRKRFPLVLVSSKTRQELEEWWSTLQTSAPFIVENGGAIFIPRGAFAFEIENAHDVGEFRVVELGMRYEKLIEAFDTLRKRTGLPLRGFHEMSVEEVVSLTNLSREQAGKAMKREYSEPFVLLADDRNILDLRAVAYQFGLQITTGGRFHHLMGGNDKGKAVRIVAGFFEREYSNREVLSVGIGDGPNDIPMLNVVAYPIVVQQPDGSYLHAPLPPHTLFAKGHGPAGWAEGISRTIQKIDLDRNVLKASD